MQDFSHQQDDFVDVHDVHFKGDVQVSVLRVFWGIRVYMIPSLKLTASLPLKNDGWKTIVSFWDGPFSGDMLVLGSAGLRKFSSLSHMTIEHQEIPMICLGLKGRVIKFVGSSAILPRLQVGFVCKTNST